MCGFGDKVRHFMALAHSLIHSQDRRPLAPAAVAKMIVRREDDSIVDVE